MAENNKWKTTQDVFRGWTKATLEGMAGDIKEIKEVFQEFGKECYGRHNKLDSRISKIDKKVAGIAGTIALLVTVIGYLLQRFLLGS